MLTEMVLSALVVVLATARIESKRGPMVIVTEMVIAVVMVLVLQLLAFPRRCRRKLSWTTIMASR